VTQKTVAPPNPRLPAARATTFPARYRLHKYWGKKPGNVVAAYIARFAEPGAPVLDFFAGSGVVLAESLIAKRPGVAVDLNPIAGLITRVAVEGASPFVVRLRSELLLGGLAPLRKTLYGERCVRCRGPAERLSTAFRGDQPIRVTVRCSDCGVFTRLPTPLPARPLPEAGPFPDAPLYPGWQMRKLLRRGLTHFRELFTPRNLVAVAHLRRAIDAVPEPEVRRALLVSFTAHLAQSTRMMANYAGRAGGPSWKLNSYWLPDTWQELNPFHYFSNRVVKTSKALADMQAVMGRRVKEGVDYEVHTLPAARLHERVKPGSMGYIFTDPPYGGEGIQYGELSMLWNLWAGEAMSMDDEVAMNPRQQKDERAFEAGLEGCLAAGYEALAPGAYASLTFASKDARTWEILLRACKRVGFVLEGQAIMAPSAPNLTLMLSEAAPKEDVISTFRKPPLSRGKREEK
jgi:adenine-specific DNA methylase